MKEHTQVCSCVRYVIKNRALRTILLVSVTLVAVLLLVNMSFMYPSFTNGLLQDTEDEAIRVAHHLQSFLFTGQGSSLAEPLSDLALQEIQMTARDFGLMKLKIFAVSGEIVYSTDPEEVGTINQNTYFHDIVVRGNPYTKIVKKSRPSLEDQIVTADVVETYVPMMQQETCIGAFEIYYDITARKQRIDRLLATSSIVSYSLAVGFLTAIIMTLLKTGDYIWQREQLYAAQKATEHALKKSEERYKELLDHMGSGVAIYTVRDDGNSFLFQDLNQAGETISQIAREDVIGKDVTTIFPGVREIPLFGAFQRVWRTGTPEHCPTTLYRDHRLSHWVENYVYRLSTGEIVAVFDDVTDRKQAEEALREREEIFRAITTSAQDAIIMIDNNGDVVFWNNAAQTIFGYDREEVLGRELHTIVAPEHYYDAHQHGFSRFQASGQGNAIGQTLELSALKKDGTEFPVELSLSAVKIDQTWNAIGIIRDISERKHIERERRQSHEELELRVKERTAELQHAKEAAESSSRAKSQFLAAMSHELRTPLNAISGYTHILQQADNVTRSQRQNLAIVKRSGDHLLHLITDILDFSASESGQLKLRIKKFPLRPFLDRLHERFQVAAQEKNLTFTSTASHLPEYIYADEQRLGQILSHLLRNAIKFTQRGAVVFSVTVEGLSSHQDNLRFEIEDSGVGITPNRLQALDVPFFQCPEKGIYSDGAGVGLALSFRLLRLMGSELHVESQLEKGTRCWFDLPISEAGLSSSKPPFVLSVSKHPSTSPSTSPSGSSAQDSGRTETEEGHSLPPRKRDGGIAGETLPPEAILADLLAYAERGNIKQIGTILQRLTHEKRQYAPFVDSLQPLVQNFQVDDIIDVLHHFQKEHGNEHEHSD